MAGIVKPDDDSASVTFPPPLVYLGSWLLGLLVDRLGGFALPLETSTRIAAVAILVTLGAMIGLAANQRFIRAKVDVRPWKATSGVIRTGIYRLTRNPMYLGMALGYLGLTLGMASPSALVLFVPLIAVIQTQVIVREERYLEAKFGDEYLDYKTSVRRWL
jgi:protein-S-isoprenylcysteine O-methyltransferase Ste14